MSAAPALRRLDAGDADFDARLGAWRPAPPDADADVADVLEAVRRDGDAALIELTARLDGWRAGSASELEIAPERFAEALARLAPKLRAALERAADNVAAYHERQRAALFVEPDPGPLSQRVLALERVGLYVPGGSAAYPSTLLMSALPARAAGVGAVVVASPSPGGRLDDAVLAAAALAGVDRMFRIGGAQAIAALAYGTETVKAVDKIVGPGNRYVTAAKRLVHGAVGLDMPAGPSEVLIIADASVDPDWLAADLLAQAEHDEDAASVLVSPDAGLLDAAVAALSRRLARLPRAEIATRALRRRGVAIRVADLSQAAEISNRLAPEHLQLCVERPDALLAEIRHAGAVFVGAHNAEALGDYCAGPSHVLPTAGAARFCSPLGVYDFVRRSSLVRCSPADAARLAPIAATLARAEGLEAHARSAELRAAPSAGPPGGGPDALRWVRRAVRDSRAYAPEDARAASIKLDAMESPYPLPETLREEWRRRLDRVSVNRYPDPRCASLVAAARAAMGLPESLSVLVGNGSDELIQALALSVAAPGRSLLSLSPSFSMYRRVAVAVGMDYRECPLAEDFAVDAAALSDAIRRWRPALVAIANPNNPTGQLCAPEALVAALDAADGPVLIDEAYLPYSGVDSSALLAEYGDRLLLLRTLSKLGLAGLRVGWLIGARRWIDEVDKLRLPYNVNALSQAAARFALERYALFEAAARRVVAEREALRARLDALAGVRCWPSHANFLLLRVAGAGRIHRALGARGTAVRRLDGSHARLADCLRVTVGAPEENAVFLQQFQEALSSADAGARAR